MSKIAKYKKDGNKINFQFVNSKTKTDYDISLVNSLRRVIIAEVPCYAIDRESIEFIKNSSMLNDDFLSFRIRLIPLNYDYFEKNGHENITIELNIENNEHNIINVTTEMIIVKNNDEIVPVDKIICSKDIIIGKLKPTQELHFTGRIMKGDMKQNGAEFKLPTTIAHYFEPDAKKLNEAIKEAKANGEITDKDSEEHFIIKKRDRYYMTEPLVINFVLEANENIDSNKLFLLGIDTLKLKLNNIKNDINTNNTEKLDIIQSPTNMFAYDYIFNNEDDTLGNLLQVHLLNEKDIKYIGYAIPHPLDKKMVIRIALEKEKFTEIECSKKIIDCIQEIVAKLDKLRKEFVTVSKV